MSYTTKKSLLKAIQSGDEVSWTEFYETYRPLIILRGRDYRLTPEELEDLCQLVVLDIFKLGNKFQYDPAKGKFRDYLRRVISHNAVDLIRKRPPSLPSNPIRTDEASDDMERQWNEEWRQHLLKQALTVLRTQIEFNTYQAFELYALKGQRPEDVARFLHISVDMVYIAKGRALRRLRKIIQDLREEK